MVGVSGRGGETAAGGRREREAARVFREGQARVWERERAAVLCSSATGADLLGAARSCSDLLGAHWSTIYPLPTSLTPIPLESAAWYTYHTSPSHHRPYWRKGDARYTPGFTHYHGDAWRRRSSEGGRLGPPRQVLEGRAHSPTAHWSPLERKGPGER